MSQPKEVEVGYMYNLGPQCIGCGMDADGIESEVKMVVGIAILETTAECVTKALAQVTCSGRPCQLKTSGVLMSGEIIVDRIRALPDDKLTEAA